MNDFEMDRLLGLAQPTPVPAGALAEAGQELLEEVMSTPTSAESRSSTQNLTPQRRPERPKRRRLAMVAAAVAVAAAVLVPTLIFRSDEGAAPSVDPVAPSPAASSPAPSSPLALRFPETSNPFLLLEADGWVIDDTSEVSAEQGSIRFQESSTRTSLDVVWFPISGYQLIYGDRRSASEPERITFLGRKAALFDSDPGTFTILAKRGDIALQVRGIRTGLDGKEKFKDLVGQLRQASAQEWLAAVSEASATP